MKSVAQCCTAKKTSQQDRVYTKINANLKSHTQASFSWIWFRRWCRSPPQHLHHAQENTFLDIQKHKSQIKKAWKRLFQIDMLPILFHPLRTDLCASCAASAAATAGFWNLTLTEDVAVDYWGVSIEPCFLNSRYRNPQCKDFFFWFCVFELTFKNWHIICDFLWSFAFVFQSPCTDIHLRRSIGSQRKIFDILFIRRLWPARRRRLSLAIGTREGRHDHIRELTRRSVDVDQALHMCDLQQAGFRSNTS